MIVSGPPVSNTGWPTSIKIGSPAQARSAVARLKALGTDFAKVYEKIPLDAYLEFASAARKAKLSFAGHVPVETVTLVEASNAGQKSVEHIRDHLLMCFTPRRSELLQFFRDDRWSDSDTAWGLSQFEKCSSAIKAFRRNQTWLVPTLVVERAKVSVEDVSFVELRKQELLPGSVQKAYVDYVKKKLEQSAADRSSERLWWMTQVRLVDRMRRQKVGFLAGTDSSCEGGLPGRSLHEELKLMVESGFTPLEALRTATINPAKYLELESDFGAIKQGYVADIVLLNGDPLKRIDNTGDIFAVVANGRFFDRSALDAMSPRWPK